MWQPPGGSDTTGGGFALSFFYVSLHLHVWSFNFPPPRVCQGVCFPVQEAEREPNSQIKCSVIHLVTVTVRGYGVFYNPMKCETCRGVCYICLDDKWSSTEQKNATFLIRRGQWNRSRTAQWTWGGHSSVTESNSVFVKKINAISKWSDTRSWGELKATVSLSVVCIQIWTRGGRGSLL